MKILVIGDAILDHYVYGLIKRQSPEDPSIPVVDYVDEEYRLGGCLNVACNLKALVRPQRDDVYVSSILSRFTADMIKEKGILYDEVVLNPTKKDVPHNRELIKTRIVDSETHKQIVRLDNRLRFSEGDVQRYKNKCYFYNIKNFDAVVVSDYNKGLVDAAIVEMLGHELINCPIFIDTKNPNMKLWDRLKEKQVIFKVNQKEWNAIKHENPQEIFPFVVTNGDNGAKYIKGQSEYSFPTEPVKNGSVIGAGDVFLAAMVVRYLESEKNLADSIVYANKAARKSVEKFGTCEVKRHELG